MTKNRSLSPLYKTAHLLAFVVTALRACTSAAATDNEEYAAAAALGVFRNEGSGMVSIDFDVPRNGPLCISVDEGATLKIAWEEYHNLHILKDATAFENCDFAEAMALVAEGMPFPDGITFSEATEQIGNQIINTPSYYACSKICASNGHKVKVCRGGTFGQANECSETTECSSDRTLDVRRTLGSREYLPVGKVCRPKNGDGYSITSGVDTPESCQEKCDDEASKCGAWEFEDHDLDNKECELHEVDIVSYEETLAMGDCERTRTTGDKDYYRCCWIAREVVEAQTKGKDFTDEEEEVVPLLSDSGALMGGQTPIWFYTIATIIALLTSGI